MLFAVIALAALIAPSHALNRKRFRPQRRSAPEVDNLDTLVLHFDSECVGDDDRALVRKLRRDFDCMHIRKQELPRLENEHYLFAQLKNHDCLDLDDVDWDEYCVTRTEWGLLYQTTARCVEEFPGNPSRIGHAWNLDLLNDDNRDSVPDRNNLVHHNVRSPTDTQIDIYILDTRTRFTHEEFMYTTKEALDPEFTNVGDHGTHVAGTALGRRYGVAKGFNLYNYAVCRFGNSCSETDIDNGLEASISKMRQTGRRGVVNLSLGAPWIDDFWRNYYNDKFRRIQAVGGIAVVAAGNNNMDACFAQPAFSPEAITVGAFDQGINPASFSNWGDCVDIWGPGTEIPSAVSGCDTCYANFQGTSMSTPYITGLIASVLMNNPMMSIDDIRYYFSQHTVPMNSCRPGFQCDRTWFTCGNDFEREPTSPPGVPCCTGPSEVTQDCESNNNAECDADPDCTWTCP